jgi:hypothetical protein
LSWAIASRIGAVEPLVGGSSAAEPQFAIQFNNPLGTFAGSELALFDPSIGMTIGGATESGGTVTLGTGAHVAMGNHAVIDFLTYSPGDPVNQYSPNPPTMSVLVINEAYTTPEEVPPGHEVHGMTIAMDFNNQSDRSFSVVGYLGGSSLNSQSTRAINDFIEVELAPVNYSPKNVARMAAILGYATHLGTGKIQDMYGISYVAANVGSGEVRNLYGCRIEANCGFSAGPVSSLYGIHLTASAQGGSSVDGLYGLYIVSTDGEGETFSYNIVSQDFNYVGTMGSTLGGNLFQGHSAFGTNSDVDATYAVVIDNASHLNLKSVGVTSRNVFEGIINFGTATNASPQDGDVWFDGTNLKLRTGGVTKTITAT